MADKPLATIELIQHVKPHPNADALELAYIKGWQTVVSKGKYKQGDKVVYVRLDTLIPRELSDSLNITNYLGKDGKVKAAKLRGYPSYGLTIDVPPPLDDRDIGTEVSGYFGITEWVPPIRFNDGDVLAPSVPGFPEYIDIPNFRNYPDVFLPNESVLGTTKIDGTNVRLGKLDSEYYAGSRRMVRKPVSKNGQQSIYWGPFDEYPQIRKMLDWLTYKPDTVAILYGEIYGPGIPNGLKGMTYGVKAPTFRAFDIAINGRYLDWGHFEGLCNDYKVPIVPTHGVVRWDPDASVCTVERWANEQLMGCSHISEGVVLRPLQERLDQKIGRVVLKFKSDAYLTKSTADFTDN